MKELRQLRVEIAVAKEAMAHGTGSKVESNPKERTEGDLQMGKQLRVVF